jgi:hypothetical protein
MSTAPAPAPDPEQRLKRSALAWEIRKYRLEARARAESEAARGALERERFDFERRKAQRESSFLFRLMPVLVTSSTAVIGALLGFAGILYQQHAANINSEAQAYIATHLSNVQPNAADQTEARANILRSNTPAVAEEIFRRLKAQSSTPTGAIIWAQGEQVATSGGTAAASSSGNVYIQYQDANDLAVVNEVIAALTQAGYYIPGKQKVVQPTSGDVRYYAPADDKSAEENASKIASTVEQVLQAAGKPHSIKLINLHDRYPNMPVTTYEVWIPSLPGARSGG